MHIEFHGGASEVGRSCIEINGEILLDAGLKLGTQIEYPQNISYKNIKAVFVSHAHLDHCGALPLFVHYGLNCPIICTKETRDLIFPMLDDAYNLQKENSDYDEDDIQKIRPMIEVVEEGVKGRLHDYEFKFLHAGHIPGSSSILIEREGKKLIYTGDINTINTELMGKAEDFPEVDILITEATYGDEDHEERDVLEKNFIEAVTKTIGRGGSVIIPAFGLGRSQEILIILEKLNTKVPIYLDGMARRITNILFNQPRELRDAALLRRAFKKSIIVKDFSQRNEIVKKQGIFITTSGMLTGGPVMSYLEHYRDDRNSTIILTGYQSENTNGRRLMNGERVEIDNKLYEVKCELQIFGFSAHAGKKELIELIKNVNPKLLILNHGDLEAIQFLKQEVLKKMKNIEVMTPKIGDAIDV